MAVLMLAAVAAILGYLYFVSKQRRRQGLPPLPIIGPLFDVLFDDEDLRPPTSAAQTTEEIPRPVANLKADVGEFMAYPDENQIRNQHPIVTKSLVEPQPGAPPSNKEVRKDLPGVGMTSTYLMMPKDVSESPISPVSPASPMPQNAQSVAYPALKRA